MLNPFLPQLAVWELNQHSNTDLLSLCGAVGTHWIMKCQMAAGAEAVLESRVQEGPLHAVTRVHQLFLAPAEHHPCQALSHIGPFLMSRNPRQDDLHFE